MRISNLIAVIFMTAFFACSPQKEIERPMEMWAFRSVMDQQPRMLTAALNEELWVSYDVQNGLLYKAWKGGVNFDGAVYTTVHGPQPTSLGYAYFQKEDDQWIVKRDSKNVPFSVEYRGHSTLGGKLSIRYEIILEDGTVIKVTESPEYITRGNQVGLERLFKIETTANVTVGLQTSFGSLMSAQDLKVSSSFEVADQSNISYDNGSTLSISGTVWFDLSSETSIKTFYHPGFDKLNIASTDSETEPEELAGAALIERSDCESCHNAQVKTVGPAYVQIARKYDDSDAAIELLAGKVIKGGNGVWGEAMMTAHPDLMESDAKEMVKYILSLDDNDAGGSFSKYTLGVKSVPIKLIEEASVTDGKGWVIHAYKLYDQGQDIFEALEKLKPVKNGVLNRAHTFSESDFDVFGEHFLMVLEGQINIDKDGSYDFRLISDDGSFLYIDDQEVIDNSGLHGPTIIDGEMWLKAGLHPIKVVYHQSTGGAALSVQWFDKNTASYELLDDRWISHKASDFKETQPYVSAAELVKSIPGDKRWLDGLHPSFDIFQARPDDFQPRVGGIDFLPDGSMLVCTWDSLGPVYRINNWQSDNPSDISVKRIASGLAEPLGIKVVDGEIYVLQKQELTKLMDQDGDGLIETFETISDDWLVSANFHEFAFGLEYKDGYFYGALATAILPGGASAQPQIPDRGKVVKISKETGEVQLIAHGLRTPNGIGKGMDGELFIADNQGDWLPASKIIHVKEGAFYGQRSVDPEGTESLPVTLPVVWLPQDEIGNSPSTPLALNIGPYKGQMIHGEVTHGGVKRVFVERVNDQYQGSVFRFTQGIEAGVNRLTWAPDGSLMIGGIGVSGNWGQTGKLKYGLQRIAYNEKLTFEMLSVSARTNGFVVTFTEPIKEGQNISADDFLVQQWYYKPTAEYGGPKLGLEYLSPSKFSISEDRKTINFTFDGLKENHMVYFRIVRPFESQNSNELWSTEAWYTLNEIPVNLPVQHATYYLTNNQLSESEQSDGWKLLFDGKSKSGLRNYNQNALHPNWVIDQGSIHLTKGGAGDLLVTDKPYENYEFYMEWKIATGGNSGIIFNVKEGDDYPYPWLTGPEMQILDNERHPDGQIFKHRAGDLYDLIPSKFVTANGPNEWNRVRIVMKDGLLQQWQNGYKVVETQLWDEAWNQMVAASKFKEMKDFGTIRSGHIVLQDHGDKVWFRNIKIREL